MHAFRFKHGLRLATPDGQYLVQEFVAPGVLSLVNTQTGEIVTRKQADMLKNLAEGKLFVVAEQSKSKRSKECLLSEAPEGLRNQALRRYHYVTKISAARPPAKTTDVLRPLILSAALEINDPTPPSCITVYRWLKSYEKSDDPRCLITNNHEKGNCNMKYPQAVHDAIDTAINERYLSPERPSGASVYKTVIAYISDANKFRDPGDKLPLPSKKMVYTAISRLDKYEVTKARYGKQAADIQFQEVKNGIGTTRVLERVEMDHTKLDLFVLDEKSNLPLGRPTLTVALETHSRSLLGYFISFEPPSYLSIMQCLKHAIWPKTYVAEKYPEIKNAWIQDGIPETLVVDNGKDFISSHFEDACFDIGTKIEYTPIKKPWYKGKVERFFGTLVTSLLHELPGTTFSNIFDKGDYDPKKHAVITLDALHRILHMWIIDDYHQAYHKGQKGVPAQMWAKGVEEWPPRYPSSKEVLDTVLGYTEERTVSRSGIELNSLFYNSSDLSHLRRSPDFAGKVKVKYDPTNLGHIRVYDPIKKAWLGVPALDFDYADKLSLWQHRVIRRFSEKEYGKTDMVSLAMTKKAINEIVHEETEKLKKTATSAKVARWKKVGLDAEEPSPNPAASPAPVYSDEPEPFSEDLSSDEPEAGLLPDLAAQLEQMEADDLDLSGFDSDYNLPKGGN